MAKVELSPPADEDMRGIWRYSVATWSERQAQKYADHLFDAMEALAADSRLGRPADNISAGLRRENCTSHVIFYRRTDDGILVVRVLHQSQDHAAHFPDDAP
jgi:toxin ParE1/3/4